MEKQLISFQLLLLAAPTPPEDFCRTSGFTCEHPAGDLDRLFE